jgi:hypothetical protein
MEVEKAEDIEEVEDVEGAKGRTSSRMGITGAAKFAGRWFQNGTRNFNLKNVWRVKEPTGAFLDVGQERSSRGSYETGARRDSLAFASSPLLYLI